MIGDAKRQRKIRRSKWKCGLNTWNTGNHKTKRNETKINPYCYMCTSNMMTSKKATHYIEAKYSVLFCSSNSHVSYEKNQYIRCCGKASDAKVSFKATRSNKKKKIIWKYSKRVQSQHEIIYPVVLWNGHTLNRKEYWNRVQRGGDASKKEEEAKSKFTQCIITSNENYLVSIHACMQWNTNKCT